MHDTFLRLFAGCTSQEFDGRCRVVIENVSPEIDGGCFPAKGVEGQRVRVEGDVFVDGADMLRSELLVRIEGESGWEIVPMEDIGNDRWSASFTPCSVGRHEYTIRAWVDHFGTWRRGLGKKVDAKQNVTLDLEIGALLVDAAAGRASSADAKKLRSFAAAMRAKSPSKGVVAALDSDLLLLVEKYPDRSLASLYQKNLPLQVDCRKAGFSAWYEFFPRSWSSVPGKHGTLRDCMEAVPFIAGMGFDVIYLPPVHPIGTTKRKGKNNALAAQPGEPGSCWAIGSPEGGHKSLHPELGTMEDFTSFVAAAGEAGISVALDIAFQCSPDHPWVKEHPDWFRWRPDGTVQFAENPPKKYEDILPIDFETADWQNLWTELKSVFLFWIDKGVTIFRVDNPHTKAFGFWQWAIASIQEECPEALFLAEAFTRPKLMARLGKAGFSQSYSYFTWRNTKEELQEYMEELTSEPLRHIMRANFWPNTPDILHEELQAGGRPKFIIRLVLSATLSSNYGMYGPAYELCEHLPSAPGKEEYLDSEKYEIREWDLDRPGNIRAEITRINRIRRDNPAMHETANISFVRIEDSPGHEHEWLMGYVKRTADDSNVVLTVVNLDHRRVRSGWMRFPLEQFGLSHEHTFSVEDLFSGMKYEWNGEWNFVELNPAAMPAHIFRVTFG